MLVDVSILPSRRPAPLGQQPPADVGDPERVEQLRERLVLRRIRDRDVERTAGIVDLVRRARRGLGLDRRPHRFEIRVAAASGRQPCDLGLECESRLEPLAHVVESCLRDEEPPVDLEVDEPVARQPA